jgi:hypothetical protein
VKLYEQLDVTKDEAYNFYIEYNTMKIENIGAMRIMEKLQLKYGNKFIYYFTILSLELLNKEITKGLV